MGGFTHPSTSLWLSSCAARGRLDGFTSRSLVKTVTASRPPVEAPDYGRMLPEGSSALPLVTDPARMPDLLGASMGVGTWRLAVPNDGALQGLGFVTQWLDWATRTTTDAISWTVGARYALDMATVEGAPQAAAGHLVTNTAFVVRIEHQ